MKKVNCIVLYHKIDNNYDLLKVVVKTKTDNITLLNNYSYKTCLHTYSNRDNLYNDILSLLKCNNMYVAKYDGFNGILYDIDFINVSDCSVNRWYLPKDKT